MRLFLLPLLFLSATVTAGEIRFEAQELDPAIAKVACYAVSLADVNGDAKPDIVAVTENRVLWYENPTWKPRVIIEDQVERDHVCIAPFDIDGDGQVDFALGAGWTKIGTIYWLKRGATLDEKWQVFPIAKEVSTHRMRFGNVLGKDRPQLVVSPLNPSEDRPGVRMLAFEIPAQPQTERWPLTVMDGSLHRVHNHWHFDANGDNVDGTLTASQEGLNLLKHQGNGLFSKQLIGTGASGSKPEEMGAGEVKLGRWVRASTSWRRLNRCTGTALLPTPARCRSPKGNWPIATSSTTASSRSCRGVCRSRS